MGTCPREQHRVDFETTCEIKRGRRKSIFTYFRRKTNFKNSCSSTRKPKSQPPPENRSSTYFQTPSSSVSEKLHGIGNYKSQNQETNITGRSICYSLLKYPLKHHIVDLVDIPKINDIFSNTFLSRISKNFTELETTHHKTRKQISPAEAYVTRYSNILTELEKLQATDLVHIPTDILREIQ
jgi:hypothetical protein